MRPRVAVAMRVVARCAAGIALLLVVVGWGTVDPARAARHLGDSIVTARTWTLAFTQIAPGYVPSGFSGVVAAGAYAFAPPTRPGTIGTLYDDRTGTAALISLPACAAATTGIPAAAIGGGWLAIDCATASDPYGLTELLNLATGRWRSLQFRLPAYCHCGIELSAVGRHWIELYQSGSGCHYICANNDFQNIDSGATAPDPTSAHTYPNLDSRRLAASVCAPLRVPRVPQDPFGPIVGPPFGSLQFDGPFAIANGVGVALERCRSRRSEPIPAGGAGFAFNRHLIIWDVHDANDNVTKLDGIMLPSRRKIEFRVPVALGDTGGGNLALTSGRLYVAFGGGFYVAPLPHRQP